MFHPFRILRNRSHRAGFLAGNRNINYRVERTIFLTKTAVNAFGMIDLSLSSFEKYRIFRTIHHTRTGHASAAHIGDYVIYFHAGAACLINHSQRLCTDTVSLECFAGILRQRNKFIGFVLNMISEQSHYFIFEYGTVLIDTTARRPHITSRTQLQRNPVDFCFKFAIHQQSCYTGKQFPSYYRCLISNTTHI